MINYRFKEFFNNFRLGNCWNLFVFKCLNVAIVLGIIIIVGVGCSGGSGDDNGGGGSSTTTIQEGVFIDCSVEGLNYETTTQSGVTDSKGTFKYQKGETIAFSLGGVLLGEAITKATITPIDLVEGAIDETHPTVTNICRFLQSLDEDGDLDNGIAITPQIRAELEGRPIDFTLDVTEFEDDIYVSSLFDTLNAADVFTDAGERTLRTAQQAQSHLRETLAAYSTADLTGVWHYQEIWVDRQLNYVGYTKGSGQLNGPFTVSCVSSDEPDETEDLTFTSSIDANGAVTITTSDDPAMKGQMNASKDVIVLVNNVDGDFNFPVLLKQDTSYVAADLTGVWHYQEIWVDRQLNYVGYTKGSGQLNGPFTVSCVSSDEPDETEDLTFTSSIDANGAVTITTSDDPAMKGQMNASKDVIVLVNNVDGDFNFPVLLKAKAGIFGDTNK